MNWKKRVALFFLFLISGIILRWGALGFPGPEAISSYWISSDAVPVYAWTNIMKDEHWVPFAPMKSQRLGFPEGIYLPQVPTIDNVHLSLFQILRSFFESSIAVYNFYYMLAAGLICASMAFVCLSLGIQLPLAFVAGLLYSALPFSFERLHHIFLSAYFDVPIGIFLVLNLHRRRSWKLLVPLSLLIGNTGLYFTYFTASILCLATVIHVLNSFFDRNWKMLKVVFKNLFLSLFPAILMIFFAVLPGILDAIKNGPSGGMQRDPSESLVWGLRLQNIFLPPTDHPLNLFNGIRSLFFSAQYLYDESIYEGYQEYIGLLPIFGIFIGLAFWIRKKKWQSHPRYFEIKLLAVAAIWFLLLGIRHGIGYQIALHISPQIRSYNRVSIYVATCGFLIFFLWLSNKAFVRKINMAWLAPLVFLLSWTDVGTFWRPVDAKIEETKSDQEFSRQVKEALGDTPVMFLPFGVWPEWPGYPSKETYFPFRILASQEIHSIYPVVKEIKGTNEKVQRFFGRIPSRDSMFDFGIRGVVIDKYDFDDHGAEAIQALSRKDRPSFESPNHRFTFIKL